MNFKLSALTFCGIVAVHLFSTAQAGATRTTPTQTDKDGLTWLNVARTNPKSLIPALKAILCSEWNAVESPGIVYDVADGTCSFFLGIYPLIVSIFSDSTVASASTTQFCDSLVRTIFLIPPA